TPDEHSELLGARDQRQFPRSGASSTGTASALKKTAHAAGQARPDVAAARQQWRQSQSGFDPARLVFIDKTGTTTNMARVRGRSARGGRLVGAIPHGHWQNTAFVAAPRQRGLTGPSAI